MATPLTRVGRVLVAPPVCWWLRPEIEGADHVPGHGPVILAPNHRSHLDILLLGAASPRPVNFLGKRELADQGIFGRVLVGFGMVPVDRGAGDLAALEQITGVLRTGEVIGVFPEGTRSPDGRLHRFRSGVARLAADAAAPVVPVGLTGTSEWWPRHGRPRWHRRPPPGLLGLRFGPPLEPPELTPKSRRAFLAALEDAVAELCGQERSGRFADIPR